MLRGNQLIGFSRRRSSGGFTDVAGNPVGETPVFRARFTSDATTFDNNDISAAITGSFTHNTTGGPNDGPYISGVSTSNYITCSTIDADSTNSANFLTLFCWIKTTSSATGGTSAACGENLFGKNGGSIYTSWGLSGGDASVCSSEGDTGASSTTAVNDDNWHLVAFQQVGEYDWDIWVDGANEASCTIGGTNDINRILRSYHNGNYPAAPDKIAGIQIYQGELTDAQVGEVFTAGGF